MLNPTYDDQLVFGSHWCGPENYENNIEYLVASYSPSSNSDGQPVDVFCYCAPARFYTICARHGYNSVGSEIEAWNLATGSGRASLAATIAKAISHGMLVLDFHEGEE